MRKTDAPKFNRRTAFWMLSFTVPYILALTIDSPVGHDYS